MEMKTNTVVYGLRVNPAVFFISAAAILLVVLYGAVFTDQAAEVFKQVQNFIVTKFGWLYILAVAFFLVFVIWLFFSRYGQIKLGPDDSEPDYSYASWFAMLFSAGMGIGLMFYSVAEPVLHYASPPVGEGHTAEAAREAMRITFFHWGMHAWAIYIIVGLSLAYFSFRHNLPLTIRSAFYPILGERIYGPLGNLVDIFAVLGTMFGVATSLGLGVMQINAGLNHVIDVPVNQWVQLGLISGITLLATTSVVLGLDRGIRRLSELNLGIAVILFVFVLVVGPTVFLLETFVQNVGQYVSTLVSRTFQMYAFRDTDWQGSWTLFYWGWWIAWSPFVGMFIARISRGRTIREFVGGVLLVPVGVSFAWLSVFGNTALHFEMFEGNSSIAAAVQDNLPVALFVLLEQLPWGAITATLATLLVITFFVTSSDSGSLVIDILTAGGDPDPPVSQRVFWALTEGAVAAVLLIAGGLSALQTAAITTGLPFALILLFICYNLVKGLRQERFARSPRLQRPSTGGEKESGGQAWRGMLANVVREHRKHARVASRTRQDVCEFLDQVVGPALRSVSEELEKHERTVDLQTNPDAVSLTVFYRGTEEFYYSVRARTYKRAVFAFPEWTRREADDPAYHHAEVYLRSGSLRYDVMGYDQNQIIQHFMREYSDRLRWWEPTQGQNAS